MADFLDKSSMYFENVFGFFALKFIYSEKATIFCEISNLDLSYAVTVKSTLEISQNFVVFSEYINFILPAVDRKFGCPK